jgi:hypothetical protein
MPRLLGTAVSAAWSLLIVGTSLGGGGCSDGGDCTDVGCDNRVDVSLVNRVNPAPGATAVRVCAEGECERISLRRRAGGASLPVQDRGERDVELELTVVGRNGQTLARDVQTVALEKHQPNGPDCGPTCHSGAGHSYDMRNLEWDFPDDAGPT